MFSRQNMSGGGASGNNRNLVEFRAGRMNMVGTMVHADPRKGMVFLHQSDGLMHFCWKDRTTDKVEDDLIIFPEDVEYKRVTQCTTGRVYVLKFKASTRRMFYWMQEPKLDKDEEYCTRINYLLNTPSSATSGAANEASNFQRRLSNMSQQQLMQYFGGGGQMEELNNILTHLNRGNGGSSRGGAAGMLAQGIGNTSRSSGGTGTGNTSRSSGGTGNTNRSSGGSGTGNTSRSSGSKGISSTAASKPNSATGVAKLPLKIDLASAIANWNALNEVIAKPNVAKSLSVHLPKLEDGANGVKQQQKEIKETIASPQFQQALSLFSDALEAAQLGPVISQFALNQDAVAAAFSGNLGNFVKALQKSPPDGATLNSTNATEANNAGEPMKVDDAAAEAAAAVEEKNGGDGADKPTEEKK